MMSFKEDGDIILMLLQLFFHANKCLSKLQYFCILFINTFRCFLAKIYLNCNKCVNVLGRERKQKKYMNTFF